MALRAGFTTIPTSFSQGLGVCGTRTPKLTVPRPFQLVLHLVDDARPHLGDGSDLALSLSDVPLPPAQGFDGSCSETGTRFEDHRGFIATLQQLSVVLRAFENDWQWPDVNIPQSADTYTAYWFNHASCTTTTTPPSSENLWVTVTLQQGSLVHVPQWTLPGPKAFSPTSIGGCVHRRTRRERQNRRDVIDHEWRARNELRPILREQSAFFVGRMYNGYTPNG